MVTVQKYIFLKWYKVEVSNWKLSVILVFRRRKSLLRSNKQGQGNLLSQHITDLEVNLKTANISVDKKQKQSQVAKNTYCTFFGNHMKHSMGLHFRSMLIMFFSSQIVKQTTKTQDRRRQRETSRASTLLVFAEEQLDALDPVKEWLNFRLRVFDQRRAMSRTADWNEPLMYCASGDRELSDSRQGPVSQSSLPFAQP